MVRTILCQPIRIKNSMKLHINDSNVEAEVTKQIILTGHLADMNFLALSQKVWDKLNPEQQSIMQDAADDAMQVISINIESNEAILEDFFRQKGLKVYTPNVEAFRKRVLDMYLKSDFSGDWPKGMVEKISAL